MLKNLPGGPLLDDVVALAWLAEQITREVEALAETEHPFVHWMLLSQLSREASRRTARIQQATQEALVELTRLSQDTQFWQYDTA